MDLTQIDDFIWVILGNLFGVPLGIFLAHWLSRRQRKYDMKLDVVRRITYNVNLVDSDYRGSYLKLHGSMNEAMIVFYSNKKITLAVHSYLSDTVAVFDHNKVKRIIELMMKDIGIKDFKWTW